MSQNNVWVNVIREPISRTGWRIIKFGTKAECNASAKEHFSSRVEPGYLCPSCNQVMSEAMIQITPSLSMRRPFWAFDTCPFCGEKGVRAMVRENGKRNRVHGKG